MTSNAKLYSPNQVALISWLVPAAAVFVLARNFTALGDKTAAKRTLLWGCLYGVWFYSHLFISEDPVPFFALGHLAFVGSAHQIAARRQISVALARSEVFDVQSEDRVIGVVAGTAIALLVLFLAIGVVWLVLDLPLGEFPDDTW